MNQQLKIVRDHVPDDPSEGNAVDAHLLRVYWHKKELEDYLPGLAQYSSRDELVSIVIAQLNAMEREVTEALRQMARR